MEPAVSAEFSWLQAALVFVATLAVDFAWTKYITASAAKLPHTAAFWSMSITYLAVWREKRTRNPTSPAS